MRRPLLALLVIPVAAGAFLLFGPSRHPGAHAHPSKAAVAAEQPAAKAHADAPSASRGDAPDPRASTLANEADLHRYLDGIEGEARSRDEVLPEDYRRGGAAIRGLSGALGRDRAAAVARDFGARLHTLEGALERKPITDQLDKLAAAMQSEKDEAARQKLLARYKVAAAGLPPLYRLEAMERVERGAAQL
jgi:hypothetical protein